MGLAEDYFDVVRKQCAGMAAIYPPNESVALGDFGPIADGRFNRLGNVAKLGANVTPHISQRGMSREFSSKGTKRLTVGANFPITNGVVTAKPALSLDFASEFSVYFAVAGCTVVTFDDLEALKPFIVQLYRQGHWDKDWKIVTTVIQAANMTVAIAQERNSKLVLEAKGDVPAIDMADASLSLNVSFDSSAADKWVTEKPEQGAPPLTPFCWMYQVKTNWFGENPTVGPMANLAALEASEPLTPTLEPSMGVADLSDWRSGRDSRRPKAKKSQTKKRSS